MKRIVWTNDIHLNFVEMIDIQKFCTGINNTKADAVLIGGDIAEAKNLITYLKILEKLLHCPIYFVLGNHDFYGSSISNVREMIMDIVNKSGSLNWLPASGLVELTKESCLIGHGSWADGRLGDYENSDVMLNDYLLIRDFKGFNKNDRLQKLNELGESAAEFFNIALHRALERYNNIILLTHVPPFKDASFYGDGISDDNFLPHFSCRVVGDVLAGIMAKNPEHNLTVLCGHTHGGGEVRILPNLLVKTGAAQYSNPKIQEVLIIK